jgi:hypothetical protein
VQQSQQAKLTQYTARFASALKLFRMINDAERSSGDGAPIETGRPPILHKQPCPERSHRARLNDSRTFRAVGPETAFSGPGILRPSSHGKFADIVSALGFNWRSAMTVL